jgi:hypothetical protein
MKNKIKYWFKSLHPSYWFPLDTYDSKWDKWLNEAMDKDKFVVISDFEASISGVKIWIANHPYGSFTPYPSPTEPLPLSSSRPKRSTVARAWDKLMQDSLKSGSKMSPEELKNI